MNTTKHCAPSFVFINLMRTLGRGASQAGVRSWRRPTVPIGWGHRIPVERTNPPVWMRLVGTSPTAACGGHVPNDLINALDGGVRSGRVSTLETTNPARIGCAEPGVRFINTKVPPLDNGQTSGLEREQ